MSVSLPVTRAPVAQEEVILRVLQQLPSPGGHAITYKDISALHCAHGGQVPIDWGSMPPSCDPVFILDNPVNRTRRKGTLKEQMTQMVLGRPGEVVATLQASFDPAKRSRGAIKRWQVESFACVLRLLAPLPNPADPQPRRPSLQIVDFGCGTGTLLLPLAAAFPHCTFTGVEMKPAAVALANERAAAAGLRNVAVVRGMIEDFTARQFDVALALHACGNATDAALALAVARRAAYIVSPCCVGKLKFSLAGGSSFSAHVTTYTPRMPGERPPGRSAAPAGSSGSNEELGSCAQGAAGVAVPDTPAGQAAVGVSGMDEVRKPTGSVAEPEAESVKLGELRHPRSKWMREHLPDPETNFRIMAKVADQNHSAGAYEEIKYRKDGSGDVAAAAAWACKAHVELDRSLAASEESYSTALFKCYRWQEMAKNDLLVGVPTERAEWTHFAELLAHCSQFRPLDD